MELTCTSCGTAFTAKRPNARFCSPACQKRERRRAQASTPPAEPARPVVTPNPDSDEDDGSIAWSTLQVLTDAGREKSPRGRAALKAARIIDGSWAVQGMAALLKDYDRALEAALAGAQVETDGVDEVEAKRQEKLRRLGVA